MRYKASTPGEAITRVTVFSSAPETRRSEHSIEVKMVSQAVRGCALFLVHQVVVIVNNASFASVHISGAPGGGFEDGLESDGSPITGTPTRKSATSSGTTTKRSMGDICVRPIGGDDSEKPVHQSERLRGNGLDPE